MSTNIGLWIDHRRAFIVYPSRTDEATQAILAHAGKHPGRIDGERSTEPHEAHQAAADDVRDQKFDHSLAGFYDEVIASVHGASSLLVFGPGEAKGEFVKRLAHQKPTTRSVRVETTDKLTDRQIAAKVREHFASDTPVIVLS